MSNEETTVDVVIPLKLSVRVQRGTQLGRLLGHLMDHTKLECVSEGQDTLCHIRRAWISWSNTEVHGIVNEER